MNDCWNRGESSQVDRRTWTGRPADAQMGSADIPTVVTPVNNQSYWDQASKCTAVWRECLHGAICPSFSARRSSLVPLSPHIASCARSHVFFPSFPFFSLLFTPGPSIDLASGRNANGPWSPASVGRRFRFPLQPTLMDEEGTGDAASRAVCPPSPLRLPWHHAQPKVGSCRTLWSARCTKQLVLRHRQKPARKAQGKRQEEEGKDQAQQTAGASRRPCLVSGTRIPDTRDADSRYQLQKASGC